MPKLDLAAMNEKDIATLVYGGQKQLSEVPVGNRENVRKAVADLEKKAKAKADAEAKKAKKKPKEIEETEETKEEKE